MRERVDPTVSRDMRCLRRKTLTDRDITQETRKKSSLYALLRLHYRAGEKHSMKIGGCQILFDKMLIFE